MKTAKALSDSA